MDVKSSSSAPPSVNSSQGQLQAQNAQQANTNSGVSQAVVEELGLDMIDYSTVDPQERARIEALLQRLVPPDADVEEFTENIINGTLSFGAQLADMGPNVNDADTLMARFLKLAIISGTNDMVMQYLAGEGHSNILQHALDGTQEDFLTQANSLRSQADSLRDQAGAAAEKENYAQAGALWVQANAKSDRAGELENSFRSGITMSTQTRAGTASSRTHEKVADNRMQFQRLLDAMNGLHTDSREDAGKELEKYRQEVARLVLAMADHKVASSSALNRYHQG